MNNFSELPPKLEGQGIVVRPLLADDFDALYLAASDPLIWQQHPDSKRYQKDIFKARFFDGALACGSAFVIEDIQSGGIIGSSRYYDWDEGKRSVAVGYTFLKRSHWGNGTNHELKALMLTHAFSFADVVWFHVGSENHRSRKAVEKLGAVEIESVDIDDPSSAISFKQINYRLTAEMYHNIQSLN